MDTEGRLERYRDADRWPTGESLAAMLDNQFAALAAVRGALPQLAAAARAAEPDREAAADGKRLDQLLWHAASNDAIRRLQGIRLGPRNE